MNDLTAPEIWFPHLGIALEHVPRVAVKIMGMPIYMYGVCIVLGVIVALLTAQREAVRTGQNKDDYLDLLLMGLVISVICTRLYYVIFSWDEFKDDLLRIFNLREGGLAIYGGILGAFLSGFIFSRYKKIPFSLIADTCAAALPIAQAIGRWGNFFNREVYGGYTDSLFAMRLLVNQAEGLTPEVLAHTVMERGAEYIQVHPTFLYESAWNIALFVALTLYRPHKKFHGEVMLLYMLGYGFIRFILEPIRTDHLALFNTGILVSQLVSGIFVVIAVVWIVIMRLRVSKGKLEHL